jgi:DNA-directed RNA polymerase, beta'' subunit/160 kD subunit
MDNNIFQCKDIQKVCFTVFNPHEIKRNSVLQIKHPETYESGHPKEDGLLDSRMGPINNYHKCTTCQMTMHECPGHFGHIELVRPMFHIGFINKVLEFLKNTCYYCSGLLYAENKELVKARKRELKEKSKSELNYQKNQAIVGEEEEKKEDVEKVGCKRKRGKKKSKKSTQDIKKTVSLGLDCQDKRGDGTNPPEPKKEITLTPLYKKSSTKHGMCAIKKGRKEWVLGCDGPQPKYTFDTNHINVVFELNKKKRRQILSATAVYEMLKKIPNKIVKLLLNHKNKNNPVLFYRPEWLLITVLPVPPPALRPSIKVDNTSRGEDDLTFKLTEIVKYNNQLLKYTKEGAPESVCKEAAQAVQYHITTYINNEIPGQQAAKQKSGRVVKSISQRLKGKEGRIRGNLMGKRVDFSGRTVITPDPNISVDEIGIPYSIAMTLTIPERVTLFNIERLRKCVGRGPFQINGANYIIDPMGQRTDLRMMTNRKNVKFDVGYVVERHLMDGDPVIVNRQPSLHKMSMMTHRAKIMPYSTARLNPAACPPYNADFDGDEMNFHVPQSLETMVECWNLAEVSSQIISPQNHKPIIGIIQDALLGSYLFTQKDVFLSKDQVMDLLMTLGEEDFEFSASLPVPAILKPKPLWTGKQIFSLILPVIDLVRNHPDKPDEECSASREDEQIFWLSPTDTTINICDGYILSGFLCKKTLSTSAGSLIHLIFNEHGKDMCKKFINHCQWLINKWLAERGFSVGIQDMIVEENIVSEIDRIIKETTGSKEDLGPSSEEGKVSTYAQIIAKKTSEESNNLLALLGEKESEFFYQKIENEINNLLNSTRDRASKVLLNTIGRNNNLKCMVDAGSKGSNINIPLISALLGQQNVNGQRIPMGFGTRSLPHFNYGDSDPEYQGFVKSSYLKGLKPHEFYFHAMGGREGLTDTAVKTAETGYIQRRLIKAMEDAVICYDGTVRNSINEVIQFCYGEDGFETTKVIYDKIPIVGMSEKEIEQNYDSLSVFEKENLTEICKDHLYIYEYKEMEVDENDAMDVCEPHDSFITPQIDENQTSQYLTKTMITLEQRTILQRELEEIKYCAKTLRDLNINDLNSYTIPFNLRNLLTKIKKRGKYKPIVFDFGSPLMPWEAVELLDECILSLKLISAPQNNKQKSKLGPRKFSNLFEYYILKNTPENFLLWTFLKTTLASKKVVYDYHLTREEFIWVLKEIGKSITNAKISPGEMVGTIAAQSISEPATQMTLNTFHYAGISAKNVTLGVPRFKEILNQCKTPKTPSMTVFVKAPATEKKARKIASLLKCLKLGSLVESSQIHEEPDLKQTSIENDQELFETYFLFPNCENYSTNPYVLRIVLNEAALLNADITCEELSEMLIRTYKNYIDVMHTDSNAPQKILRIRVVNDDIYTKDWIMNIVPKAMKQRENYENEKHHIFMRSLENVLLEKLILRGIPAIQDACVVPKNNNITGEKEYVIETIGSDLPAVMGIPGVDFRRTTTNHILSIASTLGIEAAREVIIRELKYVISFDGSDVDYRHLYLLADVMTQKGSLMPINRHGINRLETGPLKRCSFEETVDVLFKAATDCEIDNILGPTEKIITGRLASIGTGTFDLLLDENVLDQYYCMLREPW